MADGPCPQCALASGFHDERVHAGPLPAELRHLVHRPAEETPRRGRPSDEEIGRRREEKRRSRPPAS